MASAIVADVRVKYGGDAAVAAIRKSVTRGLLASGNLLTTRAKATVSRQVNTGVTKTRTRATRRGAKGSTYTVYPNPSKPGEPPKVRTRFGARNITMLPGDWNEVYVGVRVNARYMAFHELGYRPKFPGGRRGRFQQRPWLFPTYKKSESALRGIFAAYAQP